LDHIEYGMRAGSELATTTPPAKVVFGMAERCLSSCWSGAAWTSSANTVNWPDNPWDLYCATTVTSCPNNVAPSFWVARRLSSVTTRIWSGSGTTYNDVDRWDFHASVPVDGQRNLTGVVAGVDHAYGYGQRRLGRFAVGDLPWEGPSGNQTTTRYLYFRGLKGDYASAGENTRTSTITDSLGEVWQDDKPRAGQLHEKIELDDTGQALRKAIIDPVAYQTGQRTLPTS
jgi:hypothetical protein